MTTTLYPFPTPPTVDARQVPPPGKARRSWFQQQLKQIPHPKTGRGWTPADIYRETGASESTISLVLAGTRNTGDVAERVQHLVARIFGVEVETLFGHICTCCPRCQLPHQPHVIPARAPRVRRVKR